MLHDAKGLAVSTASTDALAAWETGVDRFLRWRAGALDALDTAAQRDPDFAPAHCTRAYVAWRMGRADLTLAAAKQAMALADAARDDRERGHIEAVDALQRGEPLEACARLGRIAADHPTDRVAVRMVGHCITQGDYRGGIALARRSLEALPVSGGHESPIARVWDMGCGVLRTAVPSTLRFLRHRSTRATIPKTCTC